MSFFFMKLISKEHIPLIFFNFMELTKSGNLHITLSKKRNDILWSPPCVNWITSMLLWNMKTSNFLPQFDCHLSIPIENATRVKKISFIGMRCCSFFINDTWRDKLENCTISWHRSWHFRHFINFENILVSFSLRSSLLYLLFVFSSIWLFPLPIFTKIKIRQDM